MRYVTAPISATGKWARYRSASKDFALIEQFQEGAERCAQNPSRGMIQINQGCE